ncbi:hypothetical protein [Phytomonospora endophytica]|uniref:Ricin B lectin domain-containing protein n=1 Tax=Phytomonospora endophytica TaxID=714109 RepID=A0A841FAD2_9ACTN|nr:hypothetical protein [Phytomonospora endophytica]MBB6032245.1 hypothetical protein [Phytomonospora endophytica]GIG68595.1 hypothetical protein Pen01_48900 [Phytomonospora endophytica]
MVRHHRTILAATATLALLTIAAPAHAGAEAPPTDQCNGQIRQTWDVKAEDGTAYGHLRIRDDGREKALCAEISAYNDVESDWLYVAIESCSESTPGDTCTRTDFRSGKGTHGWAETTRLPVSTCVRAWGAMVLTDATFTYAESEPAASTCA